MDTNGFALAPPAVAALEASATVVDTPCGAGRLRWRIWGSGPPLVLLHGASGSWTHWLCNVAALAAHFRVTVPDLPGFGDSDLPPPPPTAQSLATAVVDGLDRVVPAPAVLRLAGFSFGGIIAGLVAARLAGRVETLVLVGPNGMALPRGETPPLRRVSPDAAHDVVRDIHRENLRILMIGDPDRADDLAVALQRDNLRRARFRSTGIPESDTLLQVLPAIRARITGIWGERDAFAVPFLEERRRLLARFQPDLDFRVVPGAGHWVPYEAPDTVNGMLIEMLGGGASAGTPAVDSRRPAARGQEATTG